MKDLEEPKKESLFSTWLYHAEKGAECYQNVTQAQIDQLYEKGWRDHPDKAKAVSIQAEDAVKKIEEGKPPPTTVEKNNEEPIALKPRRGRPPGISSRKVS